MNGKTKMIAGIALALGILPIAFLATPIQAYVNGNTNDALLQTQDRDRIRTQDCNCTCNCTQTQYHNREKTNEGATNRICNCTMNLEQFRCQYRERTRSQGS